MSLIRAIQKHKNMRFSGCQQQSLRLQPPFLYGPLAASGFALLFRPLSRLRDPDLLAQIDQHALEAKVRFVSLAAEILADT